MFPRLSQWLQTVTSSNRKGRWFARKSAARCRPAVEALECRLTPAYPAITPLTGPANPFNPFDVGSNSTPTFADFDGDGDLDAFVGANDGLLRGFLNTGTATSPNTVQRSMTMDRSIFLRG